MSSRKEKSSKGSIFVISAPAGTGKTTLVQMLVNEFDDVVQSVSCTTRSPREEEVRGTHYEFLSDEEFSQREKDGDFLECVHLFGHRYGTSKSWIDERLNQGKHVVLVIDTQGALQLMHRLPAVYIFISAPSMEELRRRLVSRETEPLEMIERRLKWAEKEIQLAPYYDYHIVNEELEEAYDALRSIVVATSHSVHPKKRLQGPLPQIEYPQNFE